MVCITGLCDQDDIDCGQGICVDQVARCDGLNDCLNWAEEQHCGKYDKWKYFSIKVYNYCYALIDML